MNRDDILRMAREAGMHRQQHNLMSNPVQHRYSYDGYEENLERFAALVAAAVYENEDMFAEAYAGGFNAGAAAEREACAKLADDKLMDTSALMSMPPKSSAAWSIAAAIRARGNRND